MRVSNHLDPDQDGHSFGPVDQHTSKNFDLAHTPDLWGWVERSDIEIVRISIFFIELSTKT